MHTPVHVSEEPLFTVVHIAEDGDAMTFGPFKTHEAAYAYHVEIVREFVNTDVDIDDDGLTDQERLEDALENPYEYGFDAYIAHHNPVPSS